MKGLMMGMSYFSASLRSVVARAGVSESRSLKIKDLGVRQTWRMRENDSTHAGLYMNFKMSSMPLGSSPVRATNGTPL